MKLYLPQSAIFNLLFLFVNLFLTNTIFSQSLGDYRSIGSGNWTDNENWEYCIGNNVWIDTDNYPGQEGSTTGAVLIQNGYTMTVDVSGITTNAMGTLTISGILSLTGDQSVGGINFSFNTLSVIVTPYTGIIDFNNKANLILPENATIQVTKKDNPNPTPDYLGLDGDCSAQQSIVIGSLEYAVCQGNTADTGLTFDDLMSTSGSLNATVSSNSPVCEGDTINLTGGISNIGWTVISYSWEINGVTTSSTQNTSISPAINNGSQDYIIKLTVVAKYKSSANVTNSQTTYVIVNNKPATPTITTTATTCSTSGSCTISNYSSSNTYTFSPTGPTVGESGLISNMNLGTNYTVIANNGSCTASQNAVVPSLVTTTYNGSWSNGNPDSNKNIVFNADYNSTTNIEGCSCLVKTGKNVTINSLHTLTITNGVTVENQANLTFEDRSSLVQINDAAVNSGNIIYKRKSSPTKDSDYVYWSSPVLDQKLNVLSPNTSTGKYYSFANNNWVAENGTTSMIPGKGYIIRVPKPGNWPNGENVVYPYKQPVQFVGVPNNGIKTFAADITGNFNLIGNPYPSAIDADIFLTANKDVLDGTIYFWTHNTAIQLATNIANGAAGSGTYTYTSDDYAAYNMLGGVAAASDPSENSTKPTGKIAAGQSFMTTSKINNGAVIFNNSMRISGGASGADNSQFFRMNTSKSNMANVEKHRVWLNLKNTQGAFKQILVGYTTGATNAYDSSFDGESFDGNKYVDFYSINQNMNLTIQGRALPFDKLDEVPLGYKTSIKGIFSISIDQVDGLLASQDIFIEDKLTKIVKNLKEGAYSFDTASGSFNNRFVLRFANKTLATSRFKILEESVLVSNKNKQIMINSSVERIDKVQVYDLLGRQIFEKTNIDNNELALPNLELDGRILLVKVVLKNGETTTEKMVF